jgi:hypothetical protein
MLCVSLQMCVQLSIQCLYLHVTCVAVARLNTTVYRVGCIDWFAIRVCVWKLFTPEIELNFISARRPQTNRSTPINKCPSKNTELLHVPKV